jgi:REP element-mobilizing transposase RayT
MYNFITFRTFKSVDEYVKRLSFEDIDTKIKQYKIDKYLDNSNTGSYLYDTKLEIMKNILFENDDIYYDLICFSIMPNHIHILIKPKEKLSKIMQKIKGKSSKLLNKSLEFKGRFWAREYYDKVIRDEKQLNTTIEYILNNPLKANLEDSSYRTYCNTNFSW